jgi:hypothetical protein
MMNGTWYRVAGLVTVLVATGGLRAGEKADEKPSFSIRGVWMNYTRDKPVPQDMLNQPHLLGCSIATEWRIVEPEEGKYRWEYLDSQVLAIQKHGKMVNLRLLAGIYSPDWVIKKAAATFSYVERSEFSKEIGQTKTMPVPWDEVYLKAWEKFVLAVGNRYKNRIAIINVTGPNRGTAEAQLTNWKGDLRPEINDWIKAGYRPERLIGAWKRCIDVFGQAFPKSYVALNLAGRAVRPDDGVLEAMCDYGYKKLGKRLLLQNNALSSVSPWSHPKPRRDFDILKGYANKTTIGFQMLWRVNNDPGNRMKGSLHDAIAIGLGIGAQYFEIYQPDIRAFPKDIEETAKLLSKR